MGSRPARDDDVRRAVRRGLRDRDPDHRGRWQGPRPLARPRLPHRLPARRRPRPAPRRLRDARSGQPRRPGATGCVAGARRPRRDAPAVPGCGLGHARRRRGPGRGRGGALRAHVPGGPVRRPLRPSPASPRRRSPGVRRVRRGAADRAPGRGTCRPRRRGDPRAPPARCRGHAPHRRRVGGGRGPRRRPRRRPAATPRDGRLGRLGRPGLRRRAHRGGRPGLAGPAAPALARRRVRPPAGRAPARGHATERGPRHDRRRPAPRCAGGVLAARQHDLRRPRCPARRGAHAHRAAAAPGARSTCS